MRQDAEKYAEYDRRRMQLIEIKNQADTLFHTYAATLKENAPLIAPELKALSDKKREQLQNAIKDTSISLDQLKVLLEDFHQIILEIGTRIYAGGRQAEFDQTFEGVGPTNFKTNTNGTATPAVEARPNTLHGTSGIAPGTNSTMPLDAYSTQGTSIDADIKDYTKVETKSYPKIQKTPAAKTDDYDSYATIPRDYEDVEE
jgi:molecular chaperone DnaK